MPEDSKSLLNLVNASGYALQLAVEREIRRLHGPGSSNWVVVSREHRWVDPATSSEQFIDLVLQSHAGRMITECKRVREGAWVFIVEPGKETTSRARFLWTHLTDGGRPVSDWDEFNLTLDSPESAFCVGRGQSDTGLTNLERLSSVLLRSAETLASQELSFGADRPYGPAWIYIPAIVTTAELKQCLIAPDKIDLATGTLPDADFDTVPVIRFRKAFSTTIAPRRPARNLADSALPDERTVLIINADNLAYALLNLELRPFASYGSDQYPWTQLNGSS